MASIEGMLKKQDGSIVQSFDNVNSFTKNLNANNGKINSIVTSTKPNYLKKFEEYASGTYENLGATFMDPQIRQLGQNIYLAQLNSLIQDENGVITVAGLQIFNEVGGQYSSAQTSMPYVDDLTRQIRPVDDTIFAQPSQVYQIRYPQKDIRVRVKNFQNVSFT